MTTRKLTVHQQAVLIQVLLAFPEQRVAVQYLPSAGDSCSYADDFLNIFKAVGWTVYDSAPVVGSLRPRSGLGIVVRKAHRCACRGGGFARCVADLRN